MKILLLRGISGSGKSTWAAEFVKNNLDWVRVNRDNIREGLIPNHIHIWHKLPDRRNLEQLVTEIQNEQIWSAMDFGYNVIVDDTNLSHYDRWDNFAIEGHTMYFKEFSTEAELCKSRIKERDGIDPSYVDKQVKTFYNNKQLPEYFKNWNDGQV